MRIGYAKGMLAAIFGLIISANCAGAQPRFFDEVRFGVYQHDTGLIGTQKETGIDFAFEGLSRPIILLNLIGSPRLVLGGVVNSLGKTDQLYFGFSKQWDFVHSVFAPDDAFFLEGVVGGVWHDGKNDVRGTALEADWKSHGSHFLFRTGMDLGYRFNRTWSLAVSFNHISNAGLANPNEGMNDIGLRLGMKL